MSNCSNNIQKDGKEMKSPLLIAIDIGSTHTKAAVFDIEGHILSKASHSSNLILHDESGRAETKPHEWLAASVMAIRKAVSTIDRSRCAALCIASEGPTMVIIDKTLKPLAHALLWMDRRAYREARILSERVNGRVDAASITAKALWFSTNRPAVMKKAAAVIQPLDFVAAHFTGKVRFSVVSDDFGAAPRHLWDTAGLPSHLMAEPIVMGTVIGSLLKEYADAMGLPEGLPVVSGTGGVDAIQVILGTSTLEEGIACDKAGTSEGIEVISRTRIKDERFFVAPHPVLPGYYHVGGIMSTSGRALAWFRDSFFPSGTSFRRALTEAGKAPPGSEGLIFLPYLLGERTPVWDEKARGVFFGISLCHKRGHFLRAVMEGVALGIDQILKLIGNHGISVNELRVAGGPSRSSLWNQIKADITGLPVRVASVPEAELLGLAILAGYGISLYPDLKKAAAELVRFKKAVFPRSDMMPLYQAHKEKYGALYGNLKPLFREREY